jgi:hypothetical protein
MELLGQSTEAGMVLAFLRAEVESTTYQGGIVGIAGAREVVASGDLESDEENAFRRLLLGMHRGYPWALFERWPNDLDWHRARLTLEELADARYANYPSWLILTEQTRRIADGARNVGMTWPSTASDDDPSPTILEIVAALERGESHDELIFVAEPDDPTDRWVLIEGHKRATAYVYKGAERIVEAFIGFSTNVVRWRWY